MGSLSLHDSERGPDPYRGDGPICPECGYPTEEQDHDAHCSLCPCWCCGEVGDHPGDTECQIGREQFAEQAIERLIDQRRGK